MDEIKDRLALLHDDLVRLERRLSAEKYVGEAADWKAILRLAREVEAFAITQIALGNARKQAGGSQRSEKM